MKEVRVVVRHAKKILAAYVSQPVGLYAAAVAYYTVFSLAPILIIALAVAGLFLGSAHAQETILGEFSSTFGQSGSDFIKTLIQAQPSTHTSILATVLGLVFVILGATGIFSALQTALDSVFSSLPEKHKKGMLATVWGKVASLGMVLSIGFVLLVSLALSTALTIVSSHIGTYVPGGVLIINLVSTALSFVLISLFLGALLKFLPSKRIAWKPALYGGLIAGIGFTLGKYLLGIYFAHSAATSAYGAASAIVLIILWAFYLSQVFFFAALITKLYFLPVHSRRVRK